jgi:hypothetical protein
MIYGIAGAAASVLFVAAGWRSHRAVGASSAYIRLGLGMHIALPDDVPAPIDCAGAPGNDVSAAIYLALARLSAVVARQSVTIDVAVHPGLKVAMRAALLADTLEKILVVALQAAPASRMLLTAVAEGDRIVVTVMDDMPCGDAAVRSGRIRSLKQWVAMHGDTLDVDVRVKEGSTMTLRLACAAAQRPDAAAGPK